MAFKDELTITPRAFKFTAKLFEFSLKDASECLELCLQQYDYDIITTNEDKVTIYGSVTLENGVIMRATNSFHNRSWFSNVSVHMNSEEIFEYLSDEGICYEQVFFKIYLHVINLNLIKLLTIIL